MTPPATHDLPGSARRRRVQRGTLLTIVVGATAIFVATNLAIVDTFLTGVTEVHLMPALAGVVISVVAICNRGFLIRAAHEAQELDSCPVAMTRTAAVGFTANKIVKSAGASGLAVFLRNGRRHGYAAPRVVTACLLAAAGSFLALGVLLAATIVVLAVDGRLTGWWIAASIGFGIYTLATILLAIVLTRSRSTVRRIADIALRIRARVSRGPSPEPDGSDFADELYDAIRTALRQPACLSRVLAHAVVSKALGALMLMSAATAAGFPISAKTALVIYATTLGASLVAFVPGGIGIVEASTTALLIAAGAAVPAAALIVALFRIFDIWLPVSAGLLLGRGELRHSPPNLVEVTAPAPVHTRLAGFVEVPLTAPVG